ncbi:MAG: tail fiber domain-containing protein [Saprospiraceae bacterium]|nr:tail fiber domain-containing protein [Saprospiraceae bacterium]
MKILKYLLVLLLFTTTNYLGLSQAEIEFNSSGIPHLNLIETEDNDWARIFYKNSNALGDRWALSGKLGTNTAGHLFGLYYNGNARWVYDEAVSRFEIENSQLIKSPINNSNMLLTSRQIEVESENGVTLFQLGDSGAGALDEGILWLYWDDAGVQRNGIFMEADDNDGGEITLYNGDGAQRAFIKAGPDDPDAAVLHLEGVSENSGVVDGEAQHLIELVNDKTSIGISDDTKFYIGVWEDVTSFSPLLTEEAISFAFETGSNAPTNSDIISKIDQFGNYSLVSDRRLKDNIQPLESVLDKVLALSPSSYYFKKDLSRQNQIGFIAQDIEQYFPDLAEGDDSQEGQFMNVNYQGMIPVLTKAIQEQQTIIDQQNSEIESLRAQLDDLASLKAEMAQFKVEISNLVKSETSKVGDDD